MRAAILTSLLKSNPGSAGMSVAAGITYTGLTQAVIGYLSLFGWWDAMDSIAAGEVGADLLKPVRYFGLWAARDFGRATAALLVRSATMMLAYTMVFGIVAPHTAIGWAAAIVSIVLSWFATFTFQFLVNLTAFWSPNARGYGRLAYSLIWFASGFFLPLRLFPVWFQRAVAFTPFPSMVNSAVEVWLGFASGPRLIAAIGQQVIWSALLLGAVIVTLRKGVARLVIQGG